MPEIGAVKKMSKDDGPNIYAMWDGVFWSKVVWVGNGWVIPTHVMKHMVENLKISNVFIEGPEGMFYES